MEFLFRCRFCAWEGPDAQLDAHLNAWCPRCGKFADPVLPGIGGATQGR